MARDDDERDVAGLSRRSEMHGDLFEGVGAMDFGVMSDGEGGLRLTVVVHDGVSGTRAHLPRDVARAAWLRMGELLTKDAAESAFRAHEARRKGTPG